MKRILGLDASQLYPWALAQYMPAGKSRYEEISDEKRMNEVIHSFEDWNEKTYMQDVNFYTVDIHTPEHLLNYFSEMQPIFKTVPIKCTNETIGEYMMSVMDEKHKNGEPGRRLVGSFFGNEYTIYGPLLRYLVHKGLKVTKVHDIIHYVPQKMYAGFVDMIADKRREADAVRFRESRLNAIEIVNEIKTSSLALGARSKCPTIVEIKEQRKKYIPSDKFKSIKEYREGVINAAEAVATTWKTVGNSSIGHTIMDKSKHTITKVTDLKGYTNMVSSHRFAGAELYKGTEKDKYVIDTQKKTIKWDTPIQVGIAVYWLAKLLMLRCYYEFIDKHIPRDMYQLIEMDTDSLYMSLTEKSLEECMTVRFGERSPQHLAFLEDAKQWLPCPLSTDYKQHMYDQRTPGLFKTEAEGDAIVALCSKMYCLHDNVKNKDKYSAKGIDKNKNDLTYERYKNVLMSAKADKATNRGLRYYPKMDKYTNQMVLYEVEKVGLSPVYVKKIVDSDGVTCYPTPL